MPEVTPVPRTVPSDVAFSASVKAVQNAKGSRAAYAKMEQGRGWQTQMTPEIAEFIGAQRSVFLATASADGQPYIQHRGGPPGFLRVLGPDRIGFADFRGNRQYISIGNLAENDKVQLFLIDYATQQRLKIWGHAQVIEDDPNLIAELMPEAYAARAERAIVITVSAWDANCPQHIPQRIEAADVAAALAKRDARIAELEARLKEALSARGAVTR